MTTPTATTDRPQRRIVVTISILMSCVAAGLGGIGLWELSMAGFPDGHRTQYERMAHTPMFALAWLSIACSLYFIYLAVTAMRPRRAKRLLLATIAYACIMPGLYFFLQHFLQHAAGRVLSDELATRL
jgi:hypothetical protein